MRGLWRTRRCAQKKFVQLSIYESLKCVENGTALFEWGGERECKSSLKLITLNRLRREFISSIVGKVTTNEQGELEQVY